MNIQPSEVFCQDRTTKGIMTSRG